MRSHQHQPEQFIITRYDITMRLSENATASSCPAVSCYSPLLAHAKQSGRGGAEKMMWGNYILWQLLYSFIYLNSLR
eukprot:UN17846